jgi:glyceraldehyde 3-phosphate dehydrogenase
MIRIGINGLGRVGRTLLRQAVLSDDIQVVGVNDVASIRMLRTRLARLLELTRMVGTVPEIRSGP